MSSSDESEVEVLSKWGKRANNYYGGSDVDELSEDEDRVEMEREAQLLAQRRKERLAKNTALDDDDDLFDEDGSEAMNEEAENDSADDSDEEGGVFQNESFAFSVGELSEDRKAILAKQRAPEIFGLLSEFVTEAKFLREVVGMPKKNSGAKTKLSEAEADYLSLRREFGLAYLGLLSFYLHKAPDGGRTSI